MPGTRDFTKEHPWRILRIMSEFVEGFEDLMSVQPAVSIFGSARTPESSPYYALARDVAARFAKRGISVITGGGPGIMEAANRGAAEAGGVSVGLNINLPMEQTPNKYQNLSMDFRYFMARKYMFVYHSMAFIIFPGGYGTMDELFEALTLIQTHRSPRFPVVLAGTKYWRKMLEFISETLLGEGCISPEDLQLITTTDDPEEIVQAATPDIKARGGRPGLPPL
ncbi:MAG TPA: TIGR00730 family Rossman fold protein [Candidatus Brocadiia bacterium]|nr:TIGR00730 family Rossman fold protein [Candidatus Brocadiia bacterium]